MLYNDKLWKYEDSHDNSELHSSVLFEKRI